MVQSIQVRGRKKMNKNLHYHKTSVSLKDKILQNTHKPAVLWFTGLSGSGKSTLANAVEVLLHRKKCKTHLLDGDNVRMGLNKDLGFKPEDRKENIRRISEVANLFAQSGGIVCTAFISPYIEDRCAAREVIGDCFVEVYVDAPLEVCEERDPKGLYKKARSGEIPSFTGVSAPYEQPHDPEITVNTSLNTIEQCATMIVDYLEKNNYFSSVNEVNVLEKKRTVAVDFDGVIHKYSQGFKGLFNAYDEPMENARESFEKLKLAGKRLVVMSSRPAVVIEKWLEDNDMLHYFDEISNFKIPADIYIDDRGYTFKTWKKTLTDILGEERNDY